MQTWLWAVAIAPCGARTGRSARGSSRRRSSIYPRRAFRRASSRPLWLHLAGLLCLLPRVAMAKRIPVLAEWIAKQASFTVDQTAAEAPSPMSRTVALYTWPDARLTAALKALGVKMTLQDGTCTVTTLVATTAKPKVTRAARAATAKPAAE